MTSSNDSASEKRPQGTLASEFVGPTICIYELARRRFAARHSQHPLYAARAAKDPEFWIKYSVGGINW